MKIIKEIAVGSLKLFLVGGIGLLTATTQATDLKITDTGGAPFVSQFSSGEWQNVSFSSTASPEFLEWKGTLKNGTLASGSHSVGLLEADQTLSDVLVVSWTLSATGTGDDFDIKFYSDGGFPSTPPDTTIAEPSGMGKVFHIGGGPSAVNVFVNSSSVPDGGATAGLLGFAVCLVEVARRKVRAA